MSDTHNRQLATRKNVSSPVNLCVNMSSSIAMKSASFTGASQSPFWRDVSFVRPRMSGTTFQVWCGLSNQNACWQVWKLSAGIMRITKMPRSETYPYSWYYHPCQPRFPERQWSVSSVMMGIAFEEWGMLWSASSEHGHWDFVEGVAFPLHCPELKLRHAGFDRAVMP